MDVERNELRNIALRLRKVITCSICENVIVDATRTPCSHHFCKNCIARVFKKKSTRECPLCNQNITKRSVRGNDLFSAIVSVSERISDIIDKSTAVSDETSDEKLMEDVHTRRRSTSRIISPAKATPLVQKNFNSGDTTPSRGTSTRSGQENRRTLSRNAKRRVKNFNQDPVLSSLITDDLTGGNGDVNAKKSPLKSSRINSGHSSNPSPRNNRPKKQPSTRLLTELKQQRDYSSTVEDVTDDPYTFIPSQQATVKVTPKKKLPKKRSTASTNSQSHSKRIRLLPQKEPDLFDSLLTSSSNSEEEVCPYALFSSPQQSSFKNYSRVPTYKKVQRGKSEIPIVFPKRKRTDTESPRRTKPKMAKVTPKSKTKAGSKKNPRKKKIPATRHNDDDVSITKNIPRRGLRSSVNAKSHLISESSDSEEIMTDSSSPIDTSNVEKVVIELDNDVETSPADHATSNIEMTKSLKIILDKLNYVVPVPDKTTSSNSSQCEKLRDCDQSESNEDLTKDKTNFESHLSQCAETEPAVCENVCGNEAIPPNFEDANFLALTQQPQQSPELNRDDLDMLNCPTQEYIESPPDDAAINLEKEADKTSQLTPKKSREEGKCVNCGKPSNILIEKSVNDASFQVNIEISQVKETEISKPRLVNAACQTDLEGKSKDVVDHSATFVSETGENWSSQRNVRTSGDLAELDENAQSGHEIVSAHNSPNSENIRNISPAAKTNDDRSLTFTNHFKVTNINECGDMQSQNDVDGVTDIEPNSLFSQTQAASEDDMFMENDDMFTTRNSKQLSKEKCSPDVDEDSSSQLMICPRVKMNRINSSPESTRTNGSNAAVEKGEDAADVLNELLASVDEVFEISNDEIAFCENQSDPKSIPTTCNDRNNSICEETSQISASPKSVTVVNVHEKISQDEDFIECIETRKRTKRGLANLENQQIEPRTPAINIETISEPLGKKLQSVGNSENISNPTRNSFVNLSYPGVRDKNRKNEQIELSKSFNLEEFLRNTPHGTGSSATSSKDEIRKDFDQHARKNVVPQKNDESEKCSSTPIRQLQDNVTPAGKNPKRTRRGLANLCNTECEKSHFVENITILSENSKSNDSLNEDSSQDIVPPTPPNLSTNASVQNLQTDNGDHELENSTVMEIEEPGSCKKKRLVKELEQECGASVKAKKCLTGAFQASKNLETNDILVIDNSVLRVDDDVTAFTSFNKTFCNITPQENISGVIANVETDLSYVAANEKASRKLSLDQKVVDIERKKNNVVNNDNQGLKAISQKNYTTQKEVDTLVVKDKPTRSQERANADVDLSQQMSIVTSGLSLADSRKVRLFATKIDAEFRNVFNKHTTHVVVSAGKDRLCERTLKYFQGIASSNWVVSFSWVDESLKSGNILPEEDFEIVGDRTLGVHSGPQKSRASESPLLKEYEICCMGDFQQITRENIVDLAEDCGAVTVLDPSMFTFRRKERLIIVQAFKERKKIQETCTKFKVTATTRDWLLDSMAQYECLPFGDYEYLQPESNY